MADLSRNERIPTKNTKNTRGKQWKTQEDLSNQQDIVTHILDPSTHRDHTVQNQQGTIHRVTGSSPRGGHDGATQEGGLESNVDLLRRGAAVSLKE